MLLNRTSPDPEGQEITNREDERFVITYTSCAGSALLLPGPSPKIYQLVTLGHSQMR